MSHTQTCGHFCAASRSAPEMSGAKNISEKMNCSFGLVSCVLFAISQMPGVSDGGNIRYSEDSTQAAGGASVRQMTSRTAFTLCLTGPVPKTLCPRSAERRTKPSDPQRAFRILVKLYTGRPRSSASPPPPPPLCHNRYVMHAVRNFFPPLLFFSSVALGQSALNIVGRYRGFDSR
jgi:hypothetical protein